jgi:hypothetical protein
MNPKEKLLLIWSIASHLSFLTELAPLSAMKYQIDLTSTKLSLIWLLKRRTTPNP